MARQGELKEGQLRVIGAGFGRTGTLSLKMALEELGFKTHHAHDVLSEYPEQMEVFYDILTQSKKDRIDKQLWNKLLIEPYNYTATVDWPTSFYFDELLSQNPGAKIILSIRDNADKWYNSTNNTIWKKTKIMNEWPIRLLSYLKMPWKKRKGLWLTFNGTVWYNPKLFNGEFDNKQKAIQIYNDWIDNVKKNVSSDKLLIFNVKQGYDPLCKFLGIEKPENCTDFPHSNSAKDKMSDPKIKQAIWINRLTKTVVYAGCVATIAFCSVKYFR